MKVVAGEIGRNPEKNYPDSDSSTRKTTWDDGDANSGLQEASNRSCRKAAVAN